MKTKLSSVPKPQSRAKEELELFTTEDAAELIGCNPETLRRKCRAGLIPGAVKWGREWRIPRWTMEQISKHGLPLESSKPAMTTVTSITEEAEATTLQPLGQNPVKKEKANSGKTPEIRLDLAGPRNAHGLRVLKTHLKPNLGRKSAILRIFPTGGAQVRQRKPTITTIAMPWRNHSATTRNCRARNQNLACFFRKQLCGSAPSDSSTARSSGCVASNHSE
jgi:excisionase family DNA binding protein